METISHRITKTRRSFARQGVALWERSFQAGDTFVSETREAGRTFGRFCLREAASWRQLLAAQRGVVIERALDNVAPRSMERGLLVQLNRALEVLQAQVQARLESLDSDLPDLPFEDYEAMTAKAIVAELDKLDEVQCRALYEVESQHKRRATVIRAIEHRLAA